MLDVQGLRNRAALFTFVRTFFSEHCFLEVDTPIRQPVIIPECNIEPIIADGQYLQTSPELCMKRLLAAGCDKIFQICPCFRKNEKGSRHLEEFTMLEWYRVGEDYNTLMDDCENLFRYLASSFVNYSSDMQLQMGVLHVLDGFSAQPEKLSVNDAFNKYSPISLDQALIEKSFDELLVEYVEPQLGNGKLTFLYDYPKELASLARIKDCDQTVAERFELYYAGIELANGFSELTDAKEQAARFNDELAFIRREHGREQALPERFLSEIDRIDTAAGIALGFDRLLMLLTGNQSINDVVSFSPKDL